MPEITIQLTDDELECIEQAGMDAQCNTTDEAAALLLRQALNPPKCNALKH